MAENCGLHRVDYVPREPLFLGSCSINHANKNILTLRRFSHFDLSDVWLAAMAARLSCAQLLTFCFFVVTAAAAAINITLTVPSGTSNHGNPSLLCTPIQWTDIVVFFLGNYVAHAATVHSFHGESAAMKVLNTFSALLFPGFALFRGLAVISSLAVFGKSELEIAARAGALGVVVRSKDWRPAAGDIVEHAVFRQSPEQTSSHGEKNSMVFIPEVQRISLSD